MYINFNYVITAINIMFILCVIFPIIFKIVLDILIVEPNIYNFSNSFYKSVYLLYRQIFLIIHLCKKNYLITTSIELIKKIVLL